MTDYEEEYSSYLEQEEGVLVWSLTITRVTPDMAGFYQCEVSWGVASSRTRQGD